MSIKISAGKFKSINIEVPNSARPTLLKNRQALFNMIESLGISENKNPFGKFFDNLTVIDCFAGSGALGIEALSRGAAHAYFVDNDKRAVSVIKNNLAKINAENSSTVLFGSINELEKFESVRPTHIDVAFLDPPYEKFSIIDTIKYLFQNKWISNETLLVIETRSTDSFAQTFSENFKILKSKTYGISNFFIAKFFST